MAKIYQILLIVAVIAAAIFAWIKHERKSAKNEVIIEQQEKTIEQKQDVIHTKNNQQKLISKPDSSVDVAARANWLQHLWKEEGNAAAN